MASRGRLRWIAQRALGGAAALWLVATLAFVLLRLAPGDPARTGDPAVPRSQSETLDRLYGLDRPLAAQYAAWCGGLLRADLGWSFHYRRPVAAVLASALPPTLVLAGLALALQYGGALFLALGASRRPRLRRLLDSSTTLLYAVPTLWLGLLALRWLGQSWGWFPTFGAGSFAGGGLDAVRHALLPALVLAAADLAPVYRLTSAGLGRALASPYALAARAQGVGGARLVWRHALPNAAAPALHRLALDLPLLVSGSLVLEVLFSRPGLGRVAHQAFLARDFPLLAAVTTAAGALVIAGSLLADLAHAALDPRVRDA